MRKEDEYNELDDFLKEKFANHTIQPSEELWKKVSGKLDAHKIVSFRKYRNLKIATFSAVAALTGAVLLLFVSQFHQPSSTVAEGSDAFNDKTVVINPKTSAENPKILSEAAPQNAQVVNELSNDGLSIKRNTKKIISETASEITSPINENSILAANNTDLTEDVKLIESQEIADFSMELLNSKPAELINNFTTDNANSGIAGIKCIVAPPISDLANKQDIVRKRNFEFGVYLLPASTNRVIKTNQTEQSYTDELDDGIFTLNGGLMVNYPINSKWFISSGLALAQYRQRMKLFNESFVAGGDQQYTYFTSAGTLHLSDPGDNLTLGSPDITSHLNLLYGEIPLKLGLRISDHFTADAGMFYRRLLNTGFNLNSNNNNEDVAFIDLPGIRKNNFGASVGAYYQHKINSSISLKTGVEANYMLTALNTQTTQKVYPWSVGVKAAIVFNKL